MKNTQDINDLLLIGDLLFQSPTTPTEDAYIVINSSIEYGYTQNPWNGKWSTQKMPEAKNFCIYVAYGGRFADKKTLDQFAYYIVWRNGVWLGTIQELLDSRAKLMFN